MIGKDFIIEYPQHEEEVTLIFNGALPIDCMFIGMTYPFPMYKIQRTERAGRHLFEFVLEGKGDIIIDGKKTPLSAGDLFFFEKGSVQEYRSDNTDPMKKIWVSLRSEYIDAMLKTYRIGTGVYKTDLRNDFLAIYNIAKAELSPQDKFFRIADHLHKIITAMSRSVIMNETDTVTRIKNELSSAVYTKCTLDDIAAKLFISKSCLIRKFKSQTGMTPYSFLMNERLTVAKTLLSSTDISVKSVSEMLCFTDEHYFSYIFKKKIGSTPSEYRQKHK